MLDWSFILCNKWISPSYLGLYLYMSVVFMFYLTATHLKQLFFATNFNWHRSFNLIYLCYLIWPASPTSPTILIWASFSIHLITSSQFCQTLPLMLIISHLTARQAGIRQEPFSQGRFFTFLFSQCHSQPDKPLCMHLFHSEASPDTFPTLPLDASLPTRSGIAISVISVTSKNTSWLWRKKKHFWLPAKW